MWLIESSPLDHQRAETYFWHDILTKYWVSYTLYANCNIISRSHCRENTPLISPSYSFRFYSKKSGKVKTAYKREYLNAGVDVDLDFAGPTIHGAAVAGYEGWLAGYQMTFDTAKSKMTQSNLWVCQIIIKKKDGGGKKEKGNETQKGHSHQCSITTVVTF